MVDPQQVVGVGFALPPVGGVQPAGQRQRVRGPAPVSGGEPRDLHQQPFPQPGLAVHGGDRVQRHRGQQPPFGRVQIRVRARYQPGGFLGHHRLRLCKLTTLGMRPGASCQQA